MNKKQRKEVEALLDIIHICEMILIQPDTEEDYNTAQKQLFDTQVELQELEEKIQRR